MRMRMHMLVVLAMIELCRSHAHAYDSTPILFAHAPIIINICQSCAYASAHLHGLVLCVMVVAVV